MMYDRKPVVLDLANGGRNEVVPRGVVDENAIPRVKGLIDQALEALSHELSWLIVVSDNYRD
jgi:hypothetical protein